MPNCDHYPKGSPTNFCLEGTWFDTWEPRVSLEHICNQHFENSYFIHTMSKNRWEDILKILFQLPTRPNKTWSYIILIFPSSAQMLRRMMIGVVITTNESSATQVSRNEVDLLGVRACMLLIYYHCHVSTIAIPMIVWNLCDPFMVHMWHQCIKFILHTNPRWVPSLSRGHKHDIVGHYYSAREHKHEVKDGKKFHG